jgi:hypothetical protein
MRFTIRDLLWLTVVVGFMLGWLLHARRLHESNQVLSDRNAALQESLRMAAKQADSDWQKLNDPFHTSNPIDDLWRRKRPVPAGLISN